MSNSALGLGQHNRNFKPRVYVQFNAADGKLYTKDKDPESGAVIKTAHDTVAGNLTGVKVYEDTYEGKTYWKLQVNLEDGERQYVVAFTASTPQALELMGRMNNANVHEPMLIGGYKLEAGDAMPDGGVREKDWVGVTLRQGPDLSTKIDPNYGPSLGSQRPAPIKLLDDDGKPVKIKGVEQIDKEATNAAREAITGELIRVVLERLAAGPSQAEGISPDEALAAAGAADRRAMAARG